MLRERSGDEMNEGVGECRGCKAGTRSTRHTSKSLKGCMGLQRVRSELQRVDRGQGEGYLTCHNLKDTM